jgi:putative glycosyltransferase (TIGR04348 family)
LKIAIITPAPANSKSGNRNTAMRWAKMLRELKHRAAVENLWSGWRCDVMLALHAKKSRDSIERFLIAQPGSPLVLALTGTDIYRDLMEDAAARDSVARADRIIVLQEAALAELAAGDREKTRVIYQSAANAKALPRYRRGFQVCVLGHLREEKDPFRCALALKHLPRESCIEVTQLGRALSREMEECANELESVEPRYRWLGEVTHASALRRLARSRLMVITSRLEGGANVVSEAIASRVPVIASHIPGNVGMLGRDYVGYFPVGDERALAEKLWRAESSPEFYRLLELQLASRRPFVSPAREKAALRALFSELNASSPAPQNRSSR